jgi:hypothetical protein
MGADAMPPRSTADAAQPADLYERVRNAIEAQTDASPRTRVRLIVASIVVPLLSASVLVVASTVVYRQQAAGLEFGPAGTSRMLIVLAGLAALTLASTGIATWRGRSGLGAGVVATALVVALAAPLYAVLVLQSPAHAPDPFVASVYISPWGSRCLVIAAMVGIGVLATLVAALRRAVPVAGRLRGAALGAAAGAWAGFALFVFCPSDAMQHILIGHVLPIAVLTLLGAAVGPRWLAP